MEAIIRLSAALGIFLIMISWEFLAPRRPLSLLRKQRWPINIGLALLNMLVIRVTVGSIAYLSANNAIEQQWGLFNYFSVTNPLSFVFTLLLLDMSIYFQHRIAHKWRPLWRLHQVHHTDLDFDATTAIRFHPLEILFSLAVKVAIIYVIGADPFAVIAFEIILNGSATFNHSNINLPLKLDRILRWLIVTPDMHRIHHSTVQHEMDSNYGFSISCWDRLFRSYTKNPQQPQTDFKLGLSHLRDPEQINFIKLLSLPFKS